MSEQEQEPKNQPAIRPYMTREKAIHILGTTANWHTCTLDEDFYDALKLAVHDMQMVASAHHATSDPRD
jgi:hypothetical protein